MSVFKVIGFDRETGEPKTIMVTATTQEEAVRSEPVKGMFVEQVLPLMLEAPSAPHHPVRHDQAKEEALPLKRVETPCPFCKEPMDIDASHCPHCGKSGGFSFRYVMNWCTAGFLTGAVVGFAILASIDKPSSPFFDLVMPVCPCNPFFWVTVLPGLVVGGIAGSIHASIAKSKLKRS